LQIFNPPQVILAGKRHESLFSYNDSKFHASMQIPFNPIISLALGLVCAFSVSSALAEKADRSKPMIIESDALIADDLKQITIATGKVLVTKGTIVIRGTRVEVHQDPEGYQFGTVTVEPGARAFYRQKREGLEEFIEGEGEVIYYDGKADTVRFVRRAEMRRYKGAQLFDESSGSLIVYNNANDVFTVDSGNVAGAAPGTGGRVRTMLTPNPSLSTAPVKTGPAPTLRSSPTMSGDKK